MSDLFSSDDIDEENSVQVSVGISEEDNSWSVINIHPNLVLSSISAVIIVVLIVLAILACVYMRYRRGGDEGAVSSPQPPTVLPVPTAPEYLQVDHLVLKIHILKLRIFRDRMSLFQSQVEEMKTWGPGIVTSCSDW